MRLASSSTHSLARHSSLFRTWAAKHYRSLNATGQAPANNWKLSTKMAAGGDTVRALSSIPLGVLPSGVDVKSEDFKVMHHTCALPP